MNIGQIDTRLKLHVLQLTCLFVSEWKYDFEDGLNLAVNYIILVFIYY